MRLTEAEAKVLGVDVSDAPSTHQQKKCGSGPEHAIQNAILEYLATQKIPAWRINAGAIKSEKGHRVMLAPKGHADIAGVLPGGRALFIEVKAGKNQPTEAQQAFLDRVRSVGAVAFVAWSVDDVMRELAL